MLMQRSVEEAREAHMSKWPWALIFPLGPHFTRHYKYYWGRDESAPMMRGAVLTAGFFCRLMLQMYSVLFLHFIHNANAISGSIAPPKEEQEKGIQPKRKKKKKILQNDPYSSSHHTDANGRSATGTAAN